MKVIRRFVSCMLVVALLMVANTGDFAIALKAESNPETSAQETPDATQDNSEQTAEDPSGEADGETTDEEKNTPSNDETSAEKDSPAGDELSDEATNGDSGVSSDPSSDAPESETSDVKPRITNSGQVDVNIMPSLPLAKDTDFTIALSSQPSKVMTLKAGVQEMYHEGVTFEGLAPGKYTLIVSAPGFATYTQELQVAEWAYTVKLSTSMIAGYTYGDDVHPGVLLIGDVNADAAVNDADKDAMIDALEGTGSAPVVDLDRDGDIDLMDLEYFAKGYQVEENTKSSVVESVPASVLATTSDADTKVDGDIDNLSKSEEVIKLSRNDGQPISDATPVSVEFAFQDSTNFPSRGMVIGAANDNAISKALVTIVYEENGVEKTVNAPFGDGVHFLLEARGVNVLQEGTGNICIDFGDQIAIKKVTLKIMETKNNNLAEISRVKFLNDMADRIPEPQMNIPDNLAVENKSKQFTVTWNPQLNVTGYEVMIEKDGVQEVVSTKGPMTIVSRFNNDDLENGEIYKVKVQSVNGTWRSGYSQEVTAAPKATKKPDKPDNVKATGKYRSIAVSWKDMEDTDYYHLFYKEEGASDFIKIANIRTNSYTIRDLKDHTAYLVYVVGVNELGESGPSLTSKAETTDITPATMPKYKQLNRVIDGKVSEHIKSVTFKKGSMRDSTLDTANGTGWGMVDNNPVSHYYLGSWDSGGFNPLNDNGVTFEFDQAYDMQMFAFQEVQVESPSYAYIRVRIWDENGVTSEIPQNKMSFQQRRDAQGRIYYMVHFSEKIKVQKLQFGVARSVASNIVTISEVNFYFYDSIEDDIMALYEDDLHSVLRSDVTQKTIDELRTRLNTKDPLSDEYHPDKESLERELKTAEDILNSELSDPIRVHNSITTNDVGRGFGGLNAWQPLGVTAAAGETITVYVGHSTKKTGESTNLQLVATQYHAEAGSFFRSLGTLKIGRNDITVPSLQSINVEGGGALYVQYTGKQNEVAQYAVRVNGGVEVPILDLYKVSDDSEKLNRIKAYLNELDAYVANIQTTHNQMHMNSDLKSVQFAFDNTNCILGATDILLDTMMFSIPAQQVVAGSGSGSVDDRAQRVLNSMNAMEDMMYLFYQHKGLNNNNTAAVDKIPLGHQNIRYQRMFAGAFMYASGNHIGIEWGSTTGMMTSTPISDVDGKYVSGRYFGWGIAHEIGHCINQGSYAVAEITNNYFAVLAQAKETNDSVRLQYPKVYEKVTSNTKGRATNVFTQLGLYWQLHLAYDNGYNYKTYSDPSDQLANLFFARVDTYSRTPSKAPAPGGIALTLSGDSDQQLMRLACASAQKDLLEFFERWGMTPDEGTRAYASQFDKETRAIYYVNDEARVYRKENSGSSLNTDGTTQGVGTATSATVNANNANQVDFHLESTIPASDVLGYEIVRCITSNGDVEKEVAGFTTTDTFADHITTMNNRVVTYEVYVIDKYLNRSAAKVLDPIKIEHDGSIDKSFWSVKTENLEAKDLPDAGNGDDNDPCGPEVEAPIMKAFDNDVTTSYSATVNGDAAIIVEFNRYHTITGFKYTVNSGTAMSGYTVYVRNEEGAWVEVADGNFSGNAIETIHFSKHVDGKPIDNIASYNTNAMKIVVKASTGSDITISELDALGVTGDNVDFRRTQDGTVAIGKLSADYVYDTATGEKIEQGSIVFTGTYKGNPAYNVVILYDQDGNMVKGSGDEVNQIILAEVPNTGNIADVSDGTWVYWLAPGSDISALTQVRAELYRVDDALTNEGQRMVSDSLFETVPQNLPEITLGN